MPVALDIHFLVLPRYQLLIRLLTPHLFMSPLLYLIYLINTVPEYVSVHTPGTRWDAHVCDMWVLPLSYKR